MKKTQKKYTDYGYGFPVQIMNAPLIKIRGSWSLNLNQKDLEQAVLYALSNKKSRLTGNEIKFIRQIYFMNLAEFGKRFGNVSHAAVIKWESFKDDCTNMNWACEKDIRLHIGTNIFPNELLGLYSNLEDVASTKNTQLELDADNISAA